MKNKPYKTYLLKTISYRFLGSLITAGTALAFTGALKLSVIIGASDLLVKPVVYFLHELVWDGALRKKAEKQSRNNDEI